MRITYINIKKYAYNVYQTTKSMRILDINVKKTCVFWISNHETYAYNVYQKHAHNVYQ